MSRTVIRRGIMLSTIGYLALCIRADAQQSLEKGKTAAQVYASECAVCHKSPQSVSKAPVIFGLESSLM